MTIAAEPEIVLDGLGAEPATAESATVTAHDPPPAPSAPSQSHLPIAESASPAMATATATPVGTTRATVVRTTLPDGSLEIRVTSTVTDVSEGHRRVTTEWYRVPASLAGMTAGEVPGALYLTRVEEEVVPLGGGEGGVPSASGGDSQHQSQEQYQQAQPPVDDYFQNQNNRPSWHESRNRKWFLGVFSVLFFGAILLPMIAVFASRQHDDDDATTSTWNDDDWRSSFFDDDDWYHHRHWYDDFEPPTVSPSPTRPPVPTASPRPLSKDTRPPWLRPYTLPPHWFAPTSSPASPRPTADFGGFTLPPFLGPWTFSPVVRGGPAVENVVVEGAEGGDLRVDVDLKDS